MRHRTPVYLFSLVKKLWTVVFVFVLTGEHNAQNIMSVAPPEADDSVEAELASFTVAPGYKIELFASEDLGIANPVAMRWDERGRLWVLCTTTYPHPELGKKPDDKLLILEDKDGDGKADTSSVFADGLNIPLGFEVGHGGVYLGEQTELVLLEDTDNNGSADKRTVLFSGFGTGDLHQTLNSFTWSPGGDLFFSQGHNIYSRIETPWGIKRANRAGIWRYRPTTGKLDNFFNWSTASVNPWGMTFNDWGEMFHKANDPEVFYSVPGLVEESNREYLPDIGRLVIKGSGIIIPRSTHIPDDLRKDLVLAGYYNNCIERMKLSEDSSGYKAQLTDPLVISSSRSFRPVEVSTGPDGAIYVLDWYNPIIGHYQASVRHPERDKLHGRIWRITANNRPLIQRPNLENQTVPGLLDHLQSDEYWVRYQVRRLLAAMPAERVIPATEEWIRSLDRKNAGYERHLLEAAGIYESHNTANEDILRLLVTGKQAGARAYAAQVISKWQDRLEDPLAILQQLVNDASSRVRLHALVALSYVHRPAAITIAAQAFDHPTDKFIRYAWDKTAYTLRSYWEPALQEGKLQVTNPRHLALIIHKDPPSWFPTAQLTALAQQEGIPATVKNNLLIALAQTDNNRHIGYVLQEAADSRDVTMLKRLADLQSQSIPQESVNTIRALLNNTHHPTPVLAAALQLARNWDIKQVADAVSHLVQDTGVNNNVRAEGLLTLGRLRGTEAIPLLKAQAQNNQNPVVLKLAALKSLCGVDLPSAVDIMLAEIQQLPPTIGLVKNYITPIAGQSGGIDALTGGLERHNISPALAKALLETLAVMGLEAPALRNRLGILAGNQNTVPANYDRAYTEKIVKAVKEKGDPARGEQVYLANPACASCHNINGKGGNIGPNLSALGRGLSPEEILIEVLWPGQNIKEGYHFIQVETRNNEIFQGNKIWEDKETIVVTNAGGRTEWIPVINVKQVTEKGSMMPSGLLDGISEEDLRDLIAYLSSLGL